MVAIDEAPPQTPPPPGIGPGRALVALARRSWRWLTSMRTALILLFLLALAAVPGSLLPQRNVSAEQVTAWYGTHPKLAPIVDRLGGFAVFASPWFSAIYLLLFTSLVGCLVPRLRDHVRALVRVPPEAPGRLDRLPAHADGLELPGDPAAVAARLRAALRKRWFRVVVRSQPDGGFTVSAEKGYLKETGNLLFHFALLALLIGVAFGSWYGYKADRVVVQGADGGFCNTLQQYDEYGLGARVRPQDLEPFCLTLTDFQARFLDSGQPADYRATVSYSVGAGAARRTVIKVNDPLRLARARVYLVGHGYAPVLKYTDRYGHTQTLVAPFLYLDDNKTSTGVVEFADANVDPARGRDPNNPQQVAFAGVYVPTSDGHSDVSVFPAERNPVLVITPYRGDLGIDGGVPSSVYTLDQHQIAMGKLRALSAPLRLRPGQTATLDDGTTVQFVGTRPWTALTVRYDPGETVVLVGAICLLLGLLTSLTGRRRRVFFRVPPGGGPVTAGGLARSAYPGFHAEFDTLVKEVQS